nr:MAG TPA: hypothetical protein [Caudoviricetes sp.]
MIAPGGGSSQSHMPRPARVFNLEYLYLNNLNLEYFYLGCLFW